MYNYYPCCINDSGGSHSDRVNMRSSCNFSLPKRVMQKRRRWLTTPLSLVTLLVVIVLCSLCAPLASAADSSSEGLEPVYLLNTMYSDGYYTASNARAIFEGIDAAFYASNYTVGGGRPLKIVEVDSSVNASDIAAAIAKGFADYPTMLGVLGPYSDVTLTDALASATVINNNLTCLGPFTGSSTIRVWNQNVYFTRAEPLLELRVVLRYVLNTLRATRIGFMYLRGARYGRVEYDALKGILSELSRKPATLYVDTYSTTDNAVNTTAFDILADTNPQVVLVWGMPGDQTFEFVKKLMTDPRTTSTVIMSCFGLQQVVFDAYVAVESAGGFNLYDRQIISSATSRVATDANSDVTHMTYFYQEMIDYVLNSGKSRFSLLDTIPGLPDSTFDEAMGFFGRHSIPGQLMVVGWLTGKILQQTLDMVNWIADRASYQAGIFNQNRYVVGGDAVFGDYGGECNEWASETGAMCRCNQGGHSAILVSMSNRTIWSMLPNSHYFYTQSECYSSAVSLPSPLNVVTMSITDNAELSGAATRLGTIIPESFEFFNNTDVSANVVTLNASSSTQQAVLDLEMTNYTVDVLTGAIATDLDAGSLLVVAPAFTRPRLTPLKQNYIFMMPTLEQEMYILYAHLATVVSVTGAATTVKAVLHGYNTTEVAALTTLLRQTAATFGYDDPAVASVSASDDVTNALSSTGINVVIGVTEADRAVLATFLTANTNAVVAVDYKDFALSYETFVDLFTDVDVSVRRRFVTFTNLPLWSDTSDAAHEASTLLTLFHQMLPNAVNHTPATLEDMAGAAFLQQLAALVPITNSSNLIAAIYLRGVISTYGMTFGQFRWTCSTTATGETCIYCNYGAQNIVVLSMERVLDPTVAATTTASTPSMVYTDRVVVTEAPLSASRLAGIIVGSVVGGLGLVAAVLLIIFCCVLDTRDNESAPKESAEPVTLVFTDIESSTALWAALPQLMPDAVATHHRVIRSVLKKYKCYEVKTIGDSFMIACKDASAAVRMAAEIQTKLLDCDWKTEIIDDSYRHFEMQRPLDSPDDQPPSALLSPNVYNNLWHGFRVRMGIHTGLSDIRRDEVTKGYDYYGDTSNMAARTEAIANGGQVIMTEATWWALSDATRAQLSIVKMGPQGLRGVPYAVDMYQLNAVPGRRFANLRTEAGALVTEEASTPTASNGVDDLISSQTALTTTASAVAYVLASCFSTYPPAQRARELQPLLSKWSVPAPPRTRGVSEEDYCQGLLNRLAVRVGRVTEARVRLNMVDGGLEMNPIMSLHEVGGHQQNPLRRTSAHPSHDFLEDAPPRLRERSAVGELRDFLRSIVSPQSSVRMPSRRQSKHSSNMAAGPEGGPLMVDYNVARSVAVDPRSGLGEGIGFATLVPTRLTKRRPRSGSRSEVVVTEFPLGPPSNSTSHN